jgi:uncharacterized DUF497 family protein
MIFDWERGERGSRRPPRRHVQEGEEAYCNGPLVIKRQKRKRERRRLCLGETNNGRLLTFVVTERRGKIRFVTAYPMPPRMREIYRGED